MFCKSFRSGNTYSLKTTIVYVKTGTNVNSTVNATSGLDLVNLIEANKNEIAKLAPNSLSITLITDNAAITGRKKHLNKRLV